MNIRHRVQVEFPSRKKIKKINERINKLYQTN